MIKKLAVFHRYAAIFIAVFICISSISVLPAHAARYGGGYNNSNIYRQQQIQQQQAAQARRQQEAIRRQQAEQARILREQQRQARLAQEQQRQRIIQQRRLIKQQQVIKRKQFMGSKRLKPQVSNKQKVNPKNKLFDRQRQVAEKRNRLTRLKNDRLKKLKETKSKKATCDTLASVSAMRKHVKLASVSTIPKPVIQNKTIKQFQKARKQQLKQSRTTKQLEVQRKIVREKLQKITQQRERLKKTKKLDGKKKQLSGNQKLALNNLSACQKGDNCGIGKDVIHVTSQGVSIPKGKNYKIPSHYVENPHGRAGSYGVMVNAKFQEKLRVDPATLPGKKGPNYSHYHKDGKRPHYSPRQGDKDPRF